MLQTYTFSHIKECLLLCCVASFEDWSNIFRTRSFTCARMIWILNEIADSATVLESMSSSSTINLSVCCVNKPGGCSFTSLSVLTSSTSSDFHSGFWKVSVRTSKQGNSQGTMTVTDNKEERLQKTKDLQCMMPHALASTTLTDFPSVSGHFTHCWAFRSALRVTNSCRCTKFIPK